MMAATRDYPDAQRILSKHGRKRLALGSRVNGGLRDETTSGSETAEDDSAPEDRSALGE